MSRPLVVSFVLAITACSNPGYDLQPGYGFERALADVDLAIDTTVDRAEALPTAWTIRAEAAELYRSRARLSGDWSDYAKAEEQLALAFAAAPEGSGPHAAQAALDLTLHRLPQSETALEAAGARLNLDAPGQAGVTLGLARIDLLTDGYSSAEAGIEASLDLHPSVGAWSDRGRVAWVTGDFSTAQAAVDQAESMYFGTSDEPRAWFHLQRGLMDLDRGRFAEALAHYEDADAAMPGYWLVHEHIAEVLWELDEIDAADAVYAEVVARTGAPDLQDTYAEFLFERGRDDEAQDLLRLADETWEQRLARFPEAAYGHAVGHYQITDPDRAVHLAEQQVQAQPSAASRTQLADAQLQVGDLAGARRSIDAALATDWRHADTFTVAAHIYAAQNDAMASEWCEEAVAMNPHSDCIR